MVVSSRGDGLSIVIARRRIALRASGTDREVGKVAVDVRDHPLKARIGRRAVRGVADQADLRKSGSGPKSPGAVLQVGKGVYGACHCAAPTFSAV
jgi:hypothetical protein